MIDWKSVEDELPPMAERVLVRQGNRWWMAGKLILTGWVDDYSLPIRGVTHWTRVIAEDETR